MRRFPPLLALLGLVFLGGLGACGSGGGGRGGFASTFAGPVRLALPVFADGSVKTLVLRNLVDVSASVKVTSIPGGAVQNLAVPARGELRRSAGSFGVTQGWLVVDTNDPITNLPIATTGFVEPYLFTERSGPDAETCYGAVLQATESVISVHPKTDDVLLLNFNPVPVTYTVCWFGATNSVTPVLLSVVPTLVGANSFTNLDLSPIRNQANVGHISVLPPGPGLNYTLAAHQNEDLVLEVDDHDRVGPGPLPRLIQPGSAHELMLEFGRDGVSGGYEDFDLLVSNVVDDPGGRTLTFQAIYDEFGGPIQTLVRTFNVPPRQSRLFATNLLDSLGLQVAETHPFADLFGDVFLAAGLTRFHMRLLIPDGLLVAARQFDPQVSEFAALVRPTAVRRTASVLVSDAQTSLQTGTADFATLSNPTASPLSVQVRAYTQTLGTEYLLPSITVPAHGMTDFRADALHLKETPNVLSQPDVPNLRFLFSSNAAFGIGGTRLQRDPSNLLVLLSPLIVRFEE